MYSKRPSSDWPRRARKTTVSVGDFENPELDMKNTRKVLYLKRFPKK